jgi:hypothetical protein
MPLLLWTFLCESERNLHRQDDAKIAQDSGTPESAEQSDGPRMGRPKGMHQKTFDRLVREEGRANQASSLAMALKMKFLGGNDFNL